MTHMMGYNSQFVTSVVAPTQQDTVRGRRLFFLSHLGSDNDLCHIIATVATSAHKAGDCQQKLPGLVIDFRREKAV